VSSFKYRYWLFRFDFALLAKFIIHNTSLRFKLYIIVLHNISTFHNLLTVLQITYFIATYQTSVMRMMRLMKSLRVNDQSFQLFTSKPHFCFITVQFDWVGGFVEHIVPMKCTNCNVIHHFFSKVYWFSTRIIFI